MRPLTDLDFPQLNGGEGDTTGVGIAECVAARLITVYIKVQRAK